MITSWGFRASLSVVVALASTVRTAHADDDQGPGTSATGADAYPPSRHLGDTPLPVTAKSGAQTLESAAVAEAQQDFQPSLALKIFSDVDWAAQSGQHPAFQLGGVDFFITGEISEQFSALSESMLEFSGSESVFDLERIYLEWHPRSWLQIRLGKDHAMLGRYMQTYHHALLFQLATARPALFAFEDEGGMLPEHQIGLEVKGDVPVLGGVLHYAVGVGNGRGRFSDDVQNTLDQDAFKSLLGQVALLPDFLPGLELGLSGYVDRIPAGLTDTSGNLLIAEPVREYIAAVHAAYVDYPIDAQAEGYWLRHSSKDSTENTYMRGGFIQLGIDLGHWTPYLRLEAIHRDPGDVFFNASQAPSKLTDLRGGVRYSLSDQAVLKAELSNEFTSSTRRFVIQAAFGVP